MFVANSGQEPPIQTGISHLTDMESDPNQFVNLAKCMLYFHQEEVLRQLTKCLPCLSLRTLLPHLTRQIPGFPHLHRPCWATAALLHRWWPHHPPNLPQRYIYTRFRASLGDILHGWAWYWAASSSSSGSSEVTCWSVRLYLYLCIHIYLFYINWY